MKLTDSEQVVLDALKALPPNSVYTDAGKKTVFRGFQLYTDRRVTGIAWHGDKGILVVNVLDRMIKPIPVRISLNGAHLIFGCACNGHMPEAKCEHIVCALFMIIHLLKPSFFKMAREDPHYRKRLLTGLLKSHGTGGAESSEYGNVIPYGILQKKKYGPTGIAKTRKSPVYQVILEEVNNRLRAHVEKDGKRIESSVYGRLVPDELEYILHFTKREDMSAPLSIFLNKWGNKYPIFYTKGTHAYKIEWIDGISCATWTEFDALKDEILLRKGCAMGEEHTPADLLGNFAFNRERTKMCYVHERGGWELWDTIRNQCLREPKIAGRIRVTGDWTIHIPKEVFRNLQVFFKRPVEGEAFPSVVCKINSNRKDPSISQASGYKLAISKGRNKEEFIIRPECRVGDYTFLPSRRVLSLIRTVEWGHVPASLRTQKRKPILFNMFFQAINLKDRKTLDEALKKAINEETFGKRKFVILARRLIRESINELGSWDMQLHFTGENWELISVDREKAVLLFLIPYQVFGPKLFERIILDDVEMVVNKDELLRYLYVLQSKTNESGIEICLDGHPIEPATWEFELDATGGTIDWFEIRPEIRSNGQTIGRELWEQALARKGVIYHNGTIQVLDEKTLHTLSTIARFSEADKTASSEIVSVPRLRIIELFSLRKHGITVTFTPKDEEIMTRLTQFDRIEERPIPGGLRAELRHYQKEGYYWLSFLYEHRFGACLADDMGLGKTIQALTLLGAIREGKVASPFVDSRPFLVVVPPSLIFNWEQEIERFCPALKVSVYRGRERSKALDGYDVILTSYGLVLRDIGILRKLHFNVVIFDEAQTIKNIFANTTGAVRQLKGFFKIALTGTPVENHIGEYYSIMDLVLPGLLGEYRAFQGQAKNDISSFLPLVVERTKPFVLRRTKERILKELPPKVEQDVYMELTEKQKKFYNRTVDEVRSTINDAYRNKTTSQAKIIALTAIMKLRQICLTPQLLVPALKEVSPKIEFLRDKLEELCSESHSSLVFSQFTSFLDIVEEELQSKGFRIFRLDGSTPVVKRKGIVEGFQGCKSPAVFLLSLKAGGQGLNLTRATYVFHLDPWWNPAVENQASDRSHRIGQRNKVIVTRLLMRHTVEEKMMALKQRKLGLYRALMDAPEKSAGKSITHEDFNFLLGLE